MTSWTIQGHETAFNYFKSAHQASKGGCDRFKWGERVRGGQKRFHGLASPCNGETTLLIPTRRSGTTRVSRSGRLVGPLHVNPFAWLLAGRRPAAGSPNRSGGKARGQTPPLGGSFLGGGCSLDTEEEGVEKSLALLGMNWLRAADWVLAERN